jgi:hypothetical protein
VPAYKYLRIILFEDTISFHTSDLELRTFIKEEVPKLFPPARLKHAEPYFLTFDKVGNNRYYIELALIEKLGRQGWEPFAVNEDLSAARESFHLRYRTP